MSEQKPVLSVRIHQDLMDRLAALEDRTGVGRAEIVERCLMVGIEDEEEFVKWLESPVHGPLAALLLHPKVIKTVLAVTGDRRRVVDATQQKVRKNVRDKTRGLRGKPAVE